ncbi:MAG: leucyl/phenylalanyl-tRNA--protein transferase, partial [Thiogranum sp.]
MTQRPLWITPGDRSLDFPDVSLALREPDGLLAVGGDLTADRILSAYRRGIFPWYSDKQPILWWSPDPRTVLFPARLKLSRSLRKTLRRARFRVTMDQAFREVIAACAAPRPGSFGTWITQDMADAYNALHETGCAHSVECWLDDRLVGGLYGVSTGRVFFGESMFSRVPDASKVAFAWLVRQLKA